MASFIDRVKVHVIAGKGGHGCVSVHREKFKPLGGPDGGDGGNGGSVIVRVDPQEMTLLSYHHKPHYKAENGQPGKGDNRLGKNGQDNVLNVPAGTVVKTPEGELLADLSAPGAELVVAQGGRGGLGNASLASKARKAPGFALLGELGEEADIVLELKSIADVALVGFPSAGKSSLIGAMSAAKPKVADYPFTTLEPHLGVVDAAGFRYTIADVPGLIPGASQGKGLGLEFLRHIERCAVIAHVIDCATFEIERDPVSDLRVLERELAAYQGDLGTLEGYVPLMERPRIVVLNKTDIPDGRDLAQMVRSELEELGYPVYEVSAVSRVGLKELSFAFAEAVREARAQLPDPTEGRTLIQPRAIASRNRQARHEITVQAVNTGVEVVFQIRGSKPERWVQQTDFGNDEAVGYLADRLAAAGVEDQLLEAGARPGNPVVIGDLKTGVVFDWEPTMSSGAELLAGRGQDPRLHENQRRTNQERRRDYYEMMDAKAAARAELASEAEAGWWIDPNEETIPRNAGEADASSKATPDAESR